MDRPTSPPEGGFWYSATVERTKDQSLMWSIEVNGDVQEEWWAAWTVITGFASNLDPSRIPPDGGVYFEGAIT